MLIVGHTGQPLLPHDLWTAWDLSPTVVLLAAGISWLYWRGTSRHRHNHQRIWFGLGIAFVLAAVVSPLDALAESLASAHMVQHVLLILVAAPLLAKGRPLETILSGLPRSLRKITGKVRRRTGLTPSISRRLIRPVTTWLVLVASIWFWHASGPYELALGNPTIHFIEHGMFLISATVFWSIVLVDQRADPVSVGFRVLAVFTLALQGVLLAALLTFAGEPWYPAYTFTAPMWGIDPLTDQQLAGLIMWIPSGLILTGIGVTLLVSWVGSQDETSESAYSNFLDAT